MDFFRSHLRPSTQNRCCKALFTFTTLALCTEILKGRVLVGENVAYFSQIQYIDNKGRNNQVKRLWNCAFGYCEGIASSWKQQLLGIAILEWVLLGVIQLLILDSGP